jgi:hypothetical protein
MSPTGVTSGTTGTTSPIGGTAGTTSGSTSGIPAGTPGTTAGPINLGGSSATSLGGSLSAGGTSTMGNRKACPPGLEKRANNDCVAPGLLKKTLP